MYGAQVNFGQQPPYGQPGYGQPAYGQPGYGMPPPPPPMYGGGYQQQPAGPTIIHINNDDDDGTLCQMCGKKTTHIARKKMGCVAWGWVCCLLWTTGFFCWLPCCMDGCKDTELVCVSCNNVKTNIQANCC